MSEFISFTSISENRYNQHEADRRELNPGTTGLEHSINPDGLVFGGIPLGHQSEIKHMDDEVNFDQKPSQAFSLDEIIFQR